MSAVAYDIIITIIIIVIVIIVVDDVVIIVIIIIIITLSISPLRFTILRGLSGVVGLTLPMARPVYYLPCSDLGQVVNL